MKKVLTILAFALLLTAGTAAAQSIAVDAANAIDGSFGLGITYDAGNNNDGEAFVSQDLGSGNTDIRVEWKINASGLVLSNLANEKWVTYMRLFRENGPQRVRCIIYSTRSNNNGASRFAVGCREEAGNFRFINGFSAGLGDVDVEYALELRASSAPGANDGSFTVFRNGSQVGQRTGMDFDNTDFQELLVGESSGQTRPGAGGTLSFDSVVVSSL